MLKGTVKWFNAEKGYGIIASEDEKNIFVHHSGIIMTGFRKLMEDQQVEYEVEKHEGRTKAINVSVIE
ncbi:MULTISPECIES: cold-shock protein [Enterococcus]|uniref:cold-shock protein n=1 Tax=Enterococcus TaxID=1350 RepID=UPI00248F470B|nr:cold shock domain-containing protein [Enterococcus dispar]